ncbi:MAG: hypothetical protein IPP48_05865 [Chitinophagaceae bacterium]|nr:hypothetical protein [Chitinophagaceae bacterium]
MIHTLKTKTINLFAALALVTLFTTLQSSSCSNDDNVPGTTVGNVSGTWRVTLYWDKKDETNKFVGYNFTFNTNGTIVASNGTSTISGSWSETSTKFNIDFGSDPVFSSITSNWLKEEKTTNSIKLKDDNPAQDDKLQFIKN